MQWQGSQEPNFALDPTKAILSPGWVMARTWKRYITFSWHRIQWEIVGLCGRTALTHHPINSSAAG
ncbi:hypothetical protein CYB_1411 [Synechococcus sp. JA-2-3B'a(2-13)]|nr:hypothetical protein CYB_1411 [Synechococcus sp. JA-2-3B'a(2-13)]